MAEGECVTAGDEADDDNGKENDEAEVTEGGGEFEVLSLQEDDREIVEEKELKDAVVASEETTCCFCILLTNEDPRLYCDPRPLNSGDRPLDMHESVLGRRSCRARGILGRTT